MKKSFLYGITVLLLSSGCSKSIDALVENVNPKNVQSPSEFSKFTIKKGSHYTDGNQYKTVEVSELKFIARFDSSAIYQSQIAENQYDINKLYGFSDNGQGHHQFSARFGWRWSDDALRLFAYVYNEGIVTSKELATVAIGTEVECSIKATASAYIFTVGEISDQLPRSSSTSLIKGYQLYPYFGGDEVAPHDVKIWIKNL